MSAIVGLFNNEVVKNIASCAATHILFGFIPGAYEAIDMGGQLIASVIPLDFVGHASAHAAHAHGALSSTFDAACGSIDMGMHGAECISETLCESGAENICIHSADISGVDASGGFDSTFEQIFNDAGEFGNVQLNDPAASYTPDVNAPALAK